MKGDRPAVLVIDEAFANLKDSGKRLRTASLLEACAKEFAITYLAYSEGERDTKAARATWEPLGVQVIPVPSPRVAKRGLMQVWTAARILWQRFPASVAAWHTKSFELAVASALASLRFRLIHCEITQMAWAIPYDCGLPTVLDAHNVETVIWERLAEVQRPALRWLFRDQAKKMCRFELETLPRFTKVICVSDVDRQRMESRFGVRRATVLPNGVSKTIPMLPPPADGPPVLLYPGALNWRPALDGASFLLREILPLVRAKLPDTRLEIVGKDPPRWLQALCARTPGVVCHGDVPSMRPCYERAHLVVVPLRVGGGSRIRILEALAYGRAIVSTTVGAEGLALEAGTHLDIADSTTGFADAILHLLGDPVRRQGYVDSGRRFIEQRHFWETIGTDAIAIWRALIERPLG